MKWFPILCGKWAKYAARARDCGLTVCGTRQPGIFKVPSTRRVCDYTVYYEQGKVSCTCQAGVTGNRCVHAGLLVEHILDHDPEYIVNDYNYLVRMERQALLQKLYRGGLTWAEDREVKRCLKAGEAFADTLDIVVPEPDAELIAILESFETAGCPF